MTTYCGSMTEKKPDGEFYVGYIKVKDILTFMKDVPPEVQTQIATILGPYKSNVSIKLSKRREVGQYNETHSLSVNEFNGGQNNLQGDAPVQQQQPSGGFTGQQLPPVAQQAPVQQFPQQPANQPAPVQQVMQNTTLPSGFPGTLPQSNLNPNESVRFE